MRMRTNLRRILTIAVFAAILAICATVVAQTRLQVRGAASNFGRTALNGGFMPDPFTQAMTARGAIDASTLGLEPGCAGFVNRPPDFILDYRHPRGFLRMYFVGSGDTTLIVHDGANRWHCNDDSEGSADPLLDINHPPQGQYDIWVGTYRANESIRGTLHITELRTHHP
jgi:hypothetical protein